MDNTKRIEIAAAVAAAVSAAPNWAAEIWEKGGHVRVYTKRRGSQQGYYEIDGDGDIILGGAKNREFGQVRAIETVASAHGVETYATGA